MESASSPPTTATATTQPATATAQNPFQDSSPVATPPVAPAQAVTDTPGDPQVAALRSMFPDFDDILLQSVLESVHGNQDRAVDALLGMSDPEYKSEAPAAPPERVLTQEELDEQFARRLVMEDEQRQHQAWEQNAWGPPAPALGRRPTQQGPEKDTMAEIGEQFTKIAETGKRTFGNLFNKVKAKMAEMDQQKQQNAGAASASGSPPQWDYAQASSPHAQRQPAQQPSYYDPNPSSPPVPAANRPSFTASPQPANAVQGYDISTSPSSGEPSLPPRPPSTSQGQPIDGGKLGLLPKRPVSLLRTSSPPPADTPTPKKPVDDDELEYVENPFEDASGKK